MSSIACGSPAPPTLKQIWMTQKIQLLLGVEPPKEFTKEAYRRFIGENLTEKYRDAYRGRLYASHTRRRSAGCDFGSDGAQEDDIPGASGIGPDWGMD